MAYFSLRLRWYGHNRRAALTVKEQTPPEGRPPQLRKSVRTLFAFLMVLLVGAAAFYGTIYLAHNQTPSVPLESSSATFSVTSLSSRTTSSLSSRTTSSAVTSQTQTSTSASSQVTTTTISESTTLTSTQIPPGVVLVIIPSGIATNPSLDFEPAAITVVLGVNNTIMWRNEDSTNHTILLVRFNGSGVSTISSSPIMPGDAYSIKLNDTGIYTDEDVLYSQWMKGTVTVLP